MKYYLIGIFIALLIFLVSSDMYSTIRNNFVLGALGEYHQVYYKCLSDCERGDRAKQLGITHGNLMCDQYCESMVTEMTRQGGPSRPNQENYPPPKIETINDSAFKHCGSENDKETQECRKLYACQQEITEKCKQDCDYSKQPRDFCMTECQKFYTPNCTTLGWTWK